MFVPIRLLIFSASKGILLIFCFVGYTSIFPSITSPTFNCSTNCTALLIALNAFSEDNPFSNLDDASVRSPTFFDVFLTEPP